MAENGQDEVIIKKVKKGGHGGHHGGAWKVAYADFVTAMMAFFLLLWLLNSTTEEQKRGIADYFAPSSQIASTTSGSDGMLGGRSISKRGALVSDFSSVGVQMQLPPEEESEEQDPDAEEITGATGQADEEQLKRFKEEQERRLFEETATALKQAIEAQPELSGLSENLLIDQTPDGLRIQLVDKHGTSMFPGGSASMFGHTQKLLDLVADAIGDMQQKIAIKGHTDATPYVTNNGYSNWELSSDRANASRRALIDAGLTPQRIASVEGLAATDPFDPENPTSPINRRISIILLKDKEPQGPPPGSTVEINSISN